MSINADVWDFPHTMTLKVMGYRDSPMKTTLIDVIEQLEVEHQPETLQEKPSAKGNYASISIRVCLKDKQQCEMLYAELHRLPEFKVVL